MTPSEYQSYTASVAEFIAAESLTHLSTGTAEIVNGKINTHDDQRDPWFSWSPCECCGRPQGGTREYLYGRNAHDEIVSFTICTDCVYFIEYGKLDDATLAEVAAHGSH